ncbi:DUF2147 domain-containing protein [Lysobacter sp. SG-8]|uniref:DUF2147 domain-containing protein n=1 Tax=Marilutibacter penaei TaxID=2759900 RepID=A0A7W3U2J6_9GAMM|nr:DUF2147 domain-containing protein [Lysobacter penaei]MBB1087445.1 DUF2147 domain-containing protein [Lysobacter penaei]
MRHRLLALLALPLLAVSSAAMAQSPIGEWTTIDDETGQPKSVVEIYQAADGSLAGKVNDILQSDRGPDPICEECPGERKGKPVKGMVILWGLKQDGDAWEDGKILDPASGKLYSAKLRLADGGDKLEVRGFLGFSLLGRTQVWMRRE